MLDLAYGKFIAMEKDDEEAAFSIAAKRLEHIAYTGDDINRIIDNHQKDPFIGVFVSAAINACKSTHVSINAKGVDYLCYRLDLREVSVTGNAGKYLGYEMISGAINIKGSSGDRAGARMRGGKI